MIMTFPSQHAGGGSARRDEGVMIIGKRWRERADWYPGRLVLSGEIERHYVSGTVARPEGITNPPIDELLDKVESKYALVIYAAKRARQINAYYSQLGEGLLEYVGPLVPAHVQEKPLSVALREANNDLLTMEQVEV